MPRTRFRLDVPDAWRQLDLSGEEVATVRAEALHGSDDPRQKARVNDMFRQGREVLRSARAHGALLATGTASMYDDGLFLAYGMVFAVRTPVGQELTLPVLSAQLGGPQGPAQHRRVTTAHLVDLGDVARVTGTEKTLLGADVTAELLTMHTMMPVPDQPGHFLVVTLASPNLPLRDVVYDLFDAITSTFRFTD